MCKPYSLVSGIGNNNLRLIDRAKFSPTAIRLSMLAYYICELIIEICKILCVLQNKILNKFTNDNKNSKQTKF